MITKNDILDRLEGINISNQQKNQIANLVEDVINNTGSSSDVPVVEGVIGVNDTNRNVKIDIKNDYLPIGDGLIYTNDKGIEVAVGAGLELNNNHKVAIRLSSGLRFVYENLTINYAGGLTITDSGQLTLSPGNGLELDNYDRIRVKLGTGLGIGGNNELYVSESTGGGSITISSENSDIIIDDTQFYDTTDNRLILKYGEGIINNGDGIAINLGSGLEFDYNRVRVKTGPGLVITPDNTISLDLGMGLDIEYGMLVPKLGRGLVITEGYITIDESYIGGANTNTNNIINIGNIYNWEYFLSEEFDEYSFITGIYKNYPFRLSYLNDSINGKLLEGIIGANSKGTISIKIFTTKTTARCICEIVVENTMYLLNIINDINANHVTGIFIQEFLIGTYTIHNGARFELEGKRGIIIDSSSDGIIMYAIDLGTNKIKEISNTSFA